MLQFFYNLSNKYTDKSITKHPMKAEARLVRRTYRYQRPNLIGALSILSVIITDAKAISRKRKNNSQQVQTA